MKDLNTGYDAENHDPHIETRMEGDAPTPATVEEAAKVHREEGSKPEDGMINKHLQLIKELGFYHELKHLMELQRESCLKSIMDTDFYRKHKNDFPKSYITHAPEPEELKQWEHFKPSQP